MKNTIIINIDTEKKPPITFGKEEGSIIPTTWEEAKPLIVTDINCITDALITLIDVADQNDYADKESVLTEIIARLEEFRQQKG